MARPSLPVIRPGDRAPVGGDSGQLLADPGLESWAIASAGGGFGRTTLAWSLAARMGRKGRRVRLVDSETGTGSLLALAAIGAQVSVRARVGGHWTLGHDDLRLDGEPYALRGTAPWRQLVARATAAGEQRLILDLPAGPGPQVLDSAHRAGRTVLLATPGRDAVDATVRLLSASVLRRAGRWLRPRLGREACEIVLGEAQDDCLGRAAGLVRAIARGAGVSLSELESALAGSPWTLVVTQVRRADDVDVGRLLSDGGAALGMDLRFQGVIPWDEDAWIRARKATAVPLGDGVGPWGPAVDDLLDRIDEDEVLPPAAGWQDELSEAALVGGVSRSGW